jgi:hypothetical protein
MTPSGNSGGITIRGTCTNPAGRLRAPRSSA